MMVIKHSFLPYVTFLSKMSHWPPGALPSLAERLYTQPENHAEEA